MSPLVCDYSFAHPNPAAIRKAGYVGVMRYVSPDPSKNLTAAELLSLHAVGLPVGLVWEAGATDELGGALVGQREGDQAASMAMALGFPHDRPIYFAADFAASGGQLAEVAAYLRAATSGAYPVGVYGSVSTVDTMLAEGVCPWGWQTSAWSSGRVSAHAQLYQRQVPTRTIPGMAPGGWDEDVALAPDWGGWDGTTPTAGAAYPTRLAAPVVGSAVRPQGDGYWLAGADGGVFSFGNAHFYGSLTKVHLAAPIVGINSSPTGNGYLLVGADGGVFTFGDAAFHGSI